MVYGSLAAFFGPLTIMLVTFVLTVRLLRREETQLGGGADGSGGGMRRCTADRKAYPTAATMTRTAGRTSSKARPGNVEDWRGTLSTAAGSGKARGTSTAELSAFHCSM